MPVLALDPVALVAELVALGAKHAGAVLIIENAVLVDDCAEAVDCGLSEGAGDGIGSFCDAGVVGEDVSGLAGIACGSAALEISAIGN